jgi:hypothetical protein
MPCRSGSVGPLSYSTRTAKLMTFLERCRPTLVNVGRKISQMDTSLRLLARFDSDNRQGDITAKCFAKQLFYCQVAKTFTAVLTEYPRGPHPVENKPKMVRHETKRVVIK